MKSSKLRMLMLTAVAAGPSAALVPMPDSAAAVGVLPARPAPLRDADIAHARLRIDGNKRCGGANAAGTQLEANRAALRAQADGREVNAFAAPGIEDQAFEGRRAERRLHDVEVIVDWRGDRVRQAGRGPAVAEPLAGRARLVGHARSGNQLARLDAGEVGVELAVTADLVSGMKVEGRDAPDVARIKGDAATLEIFRRTDGGSERLADGAQARIPAAAIN